MRRGREKKETEYKGERSSRSRRSVEEKREGEKEASVQLKPKTLSRGKIFSFLSHIVYGKIRRQPD